MDHDHHDMPTEGRALTAVAVSATLHCLTGCALGEVAGMAIGTALGFSDLGTILLAVGLAFVFGYSLTSLPLLRAGLALGAVIPIALASDTFSIAVMEVVDNVIMLTIPGAMEAGLGDLLFWGALSFALALAFVAAVPVNRWLIARGKGHAAVHETGIHGGPSPRVVGAALATAAIFGSTVLIAEAATNEGGTHGGGHEEAVTAGEVADEPIPGLAVEQGGLRLELDRGSLPAQRPSELSFRVVSGDGAAVTDYDVEHNREMHLILVRRDLSGFQHLHPRMSADGTWTATVDPPSSGSYRVFADFTHEGEALTLGSDVAVDGDADYDELPAAAPTARTVGGYDVTLAAGAPVAAESSELTFEVTRDGDPVEVEPYLGADGHLVALRAGDLAFLHVHPVEAPTDEAGTISFMTEFPSDGRYRLYLQFKHEGEVQTAEFTQEVSR